MNSSNLRILAGNRDRYWEERVVCVCVGRREGGEEGGEGEQEGLHINKSIR